MEAGGLMPERNGWTPVDEPKGWTLVEPAKKPDEQPKGDLGRFAGAKMLGDAVIGAGKAAVNNPVQSLAMLGGLAAAPFTGGSSLVAAGLGAAGGAGLGSIVNAARGGENGPKTAGGVVKTMAGEGAAGAVGQGIGTGAAKLLKIAGAKLYKGALRPSATLQKDFGDIAAVGLRERIPVSEGGAMRTMQGIEDSSAAVERALVALDDARPDVRGYLPAGRGVDLGKPPIHPTTPELRDPRSAGVLLRDAPEAATNTGEAAHGSMVAPAEIARRGLSGARAEVAI
jgi:hypothetical protein